MGILDEPVKNPERLQVPVPGHGHQAQPLPAIRLPGDRVLVLIQDFSGLTGFSLEMKRLEELVYNIDPDAFTIMGSGFYVLGQGFSKRKVY